VRGRKDIKLFIFSAYCLHPELKLAKAAFQAAVLAKWLLPIVMSGCESWTVKKDER